MSYDTSRLMRDCIAPYALYKSVAINFATGATVLWLGTASVVAPSVGGTCTGFYVDETHVVTCAHCVQPNSIIQIVRIDDAKAQATVVFADSALDIAVLSSESHCHTPLQIGDSDSLKLLDDLYVFGFPLASILGQELSAAEGRLNARRHAFGKNWLQLDATINPGNSGGPVVNKFGQLVGIAVAKLLPLPIRGATVITPERINFAIPSSTLCSRLLEAHISFSISRSPARQTEDVFATAREATVLLLISLSKPPTASAQPATKRASNVSVDAIMAKGRNGKPTTNFPADFPKIYAMFKTKGIKDGDKVRGVLTAEDVGDVAPPNTKVLDKTLALDGDTDDGDFNFSKPTNGWPVGKYRVEIYVNDELATTTKFTIKAAKSKKASEEEESSGD
jgi:hypothetical protein